MPARKGVGLAHSAEVPSASERRRAGILFALVRRVIRHMKVMKIRSFLRYPKATGIAFALCSLIAGATALEAADFGASGWAFAPLLLWLATVGLPTTVAVLLLATVWGTFEPLFGFWAFCLVAAIVAAKLQVLAIRALAHLGGRVL